MDTPSRARPAARAVARLLALACSVVAVQTWCAHAVTARAAGPASASVGYLTDASNGGFNLWKDAFGLVPPSDGGSYSTQAPAGALTVSVHTLDMVRLDTPGDAQLSGIDTLVMFETCDVGRHPGAMRAINAFVDAGHKVIITLGAQCTGTQGGVADFSTFVAPFTANYLEPDPQQTNPSSPYSFVEQGNPLTAGFPDCAAGSADGCEPTNSTADASVLSPNSQGWCTALAGRTNNGVGRLRGPMMAYTRSPSSRGLVLYEGEAFAWAVSRPRDRAHLRLLFDDMLTQPSNPDDLPCTQPSRSLSLAPAQDEVGVGSREQLTATVAAGSTPSVGVPVTFTDLDGPNVKLAPITATTGADGVAAISYTSQVTGTDLWQATFTDAEDHASNTARITWKSRGWTPFPTPRPAVHPGSGSPSASASSGNTVGGPSATAAGPAGSGQANSALPCATASPSPIQSTGSITGCEDPDPPSAGGHTGILVTVVALALLGGAAGTALYVRRHTRRRRHE